MLFNFQGPSLYLAEVLAYFITPSLVCQALFSTFFVDPLTLSLTAWLLYHAISSLSTGFFEVFEVFSIFFFSPPTFQYLFDSSQRQLSYNTISCFLCQQSFQFFILKKPKGEFNQLLYLPFICFFPALISRKGAEHRKNLIHSCFPPRFSLPTPSQEKPQWIDPNHSPHYVLWLDPSGKNVQRSCGTVLLSLYHHCWTP